MLFIAHRVEIYSMFESRLNVKTRRGVDEVIKSHYR